MTSTMKTPSRIIPSGGFVVQPTTSRKSRTLDARHICRSLSDLGAALENSWRFAQVMLTLSRLLWEFDIFREGAGPNWAEQEVHPSEYPTKQHISVRKEGPILKFKPRFQ